MRRTNGRRHHLSLVERIDKMTLIILVSCHVCMEFDSLSGAPPHNKPYGTESFLGNRQNIFGSFLLKVEVEHVVKICTSGRQRPAYPE